MGVSDRSVPVADQGGSDQQISAIGATAAAALAPGGVSFDVDDLLSWAAGAQDAGMGRAGEVVGVISRGQYLGSAGRHVWLKLNQYAPVSIRPGVSVMGSGIPIIAYAFNCLYVRAPNEAQDSSSIQCAKLLRRK